mmetsp:Transcript_357/g.1133  ORF Transcript_357/g.1133 Transcript_357/m.1133 type:complete len:283 (+) Transcript_357:309-1157(+)
MVPLALQRPGARAAWLPRVRRRPPRLWPLRQAAHAVHRAAVGGAARRLCDARRRAARAVQGGDRGEQPRRLCLARRRGRRPRVHRGRRAAERGRPVCVAARRRRRPGRARRRGRARRVDGRNARARVGARATDGAVWLLPAHQAARAHPAGAHVRVRAQRVQRRRRARPIDRRAGGRSKRGGDLLPDCLAQRARAEHDDRRAARPPRPRLAAAAALGRARPVDPTSGCGQDHRAAPERGARLGRRRPLPARRGARAGERRARRVARAAARCQAHPAARANRR